MTDVPSREELKAIWDEVSRRSDDYLRAPLPNSLDLALATLVERFADGDDETRQAIRETLTLDAARALAVYGERMASQAVHDDSSALLLRGLVAVGIAAAREYEKELLLLMPLFDRSAQLLTIDADALFGHAAEILGASAPAWLRDFPERSDADRSLEAMGYEEQPAERGLLYKRTAPTLSREQVDDLDRWLNEDG